MDQPTISRLLDSFAEVGVRVLWVAVEAVVIFVLYRLIRATVNRLVARAAGPVPTDLTLAEDERAVELAERRRRLETMGSFGLRLVRWAAYTVAIVVGVEVLAPGVWTAIGALGVGLGVAIGGAVGFGAQQLVRDYLNGMLILGENPYSVGDVIAVAGVRGTVEEVGIRRTVLRDTDGTVHSVPNGQITVASNFTRTYAMVNEQVMVANGTDIGRATSLIDAIGREMAADPAWGSRILQAPAVIGVEPVVDQGIPILVRASVKPGEQWAVARELRGRIVNAFAANHVELPNARRFVMAARGPAGGPSAASTSSQPRDAATDDRGEDGVDVDTDAGPPEEVASVDRDAAPGR